MIITETYMTRPDGVELVRTYSDQDMYIRCDQTMAEYEEAIDPVGSGRTYTETDTPIPTDEDLEQIARILLGEE